MSKNNKHEEFYFDTTGEILPLQVVVDYANTKDKAFTYYRGHMYCSECRKARLNLTQPTSGAASYLSTYKREPHEKNCILEVESASKKVSEKHFRNMDDKQITSLLDTMLLKELKKEVDSKNKQNRTATSFKGDDPYLIKSRTSTASNTKRLPKKLLSNNLSYQSNADLIYVFYGKVKLNVKNRISSNNYPYNDLMISIKKDNRWIEVAKVYRNQIVDLVDPNKEYHIVLIGSLDSKYDKQINLVCNKSSAIRFIEIQ